MTQEFPPKYFLKRNKTHVTTETCIQMSTATLSKIATNWNNPFSMQKNRQMYIHGMRYYPVIERTKLIIIATQVTLYMEQMKPYTKKYIYHSTFIKFSGISITKSMMLKIRIILTCVVKIFGRGTREPSEVLVMFCILDRSLRSISQ